MTFCPILHPQLWSSDGDARTEDEIVDVLAGMSELVLSLPPADRDRHLAAPDGYGANLLHLAATAWTWREPDEQRLLLVQRLLLAVLAAAPGALHLRVPGPYVLLKQDAGGAMPLHLAAIVDSPLVAGFLIQHGANIK